MKVAVYFNLHTHLWSIKALEGKNKGRVVAHARRLTLSDVSFRVSEAGRQKVLREQVKNVHAYVVGYLNLIEGATWRYPETFIQNGEWPEIDDSERCYITYNPYRDTGFIDRETRSPVDHFPWVIMDEDRFVYSQK